MRSSLCARRPCATRRRGAAWTRRTPTDPASPCRSWGTSSTRGTSSRPKSSCCRRSWPITKGACVLIWDVLTRIWCWQIWSFAFAVKKQKTRSWPPVRHPHQSWGPPLVLRRSPSPESSACESRLQATSAHQKLNLCFFSFCCFTFAINISHLASLASVFQHFV